MTEEKKLPACCQKSSHPGKKGFLRGIIFGLIPHTFCILFVVFTLLGSILGASIAKKFLIIPHFFLYLVIFSFLLASLSAFFYLRNNRCCNARGIKNNWKYLSILYGTTIFVNIAFVFYIFPAITSKTTDTKDQMIKALSGNDSYMLISMEVEIPCSGHAPLIIDELKKTSGVISVSYEPQNFFSVQYDSKLVSENDIFSLEIFKTYKANKTIWKKQF